jgi:hypothetical protein
MRILRHLDTSLRLHGNGEMLKVGNVILYFASTSSNSQTLSENGPLWLTGMKKLNLVSLQGNTFVPSVHLPLSKKILNQYHQVQIKKQITDNVSQPTASNDENEKTQTPIANNSIQLEADIFTQILQIAETSLNNEVIAARDAMEELWKDKLKVAMIEARDNERDLLHNKHKNDIDQLQKDLYIEQEKHLKTQTDYNITLASVDAEKNIILSQLNKVIHDSEDKKKEIYNQLQHLQQDAKNIKKNLKDISLFVSTKADKTKLETNSLLKQMFEEFQLKLLDTRNSMHTQIKTIKDEYIAREQLFSEASALSLSAMQHELDISNENSKQFVINAEKIQQDLQDSLRLAERNFFEAIQEKDKIIAKEKLSNEQLMNKYMQLEIELQNIRTQLQSTVPIHVMEEKQTQVIAQVEAMASQTVQEEIAKIVRKCEEEKELERQIASKTIKRLENKIHEEQKDSQLALASAQEAISNMVNNLEVLRMSNEDLLGQFTQKKIPEAFEEGKKVGQEVIDTLEKDLTDLKQKQSELMMKLVNYEQIIANMEKKNVEEKSNFLLTEKKLRAEILIMEEQEKELLMQCRSDKANTIACLENQHVFEKEKLIKEYQDEINELKSLSQKKYIEYETVIQAVRDQAALALVEAEKTHKSLMEQTKDETRNEINKFKEKADEEQLLHKQELHKLRMTSNNEMLSMKAIHIEEIKKMQEFAVEEKNRINISWTKQIDDVKEKHISELKSADAKLKEEQEKLSLIIDDQAKNIQNLKKELDTSWKSANALTEKIRQDSKEEYKLLELKHETELQNVIAKGMTAAQEAASEAMTTMATEWNGKVNTLRNELELEQNAYKLLYQEAQNFQVELEKVKKDAKKAAEEAEISRKIAIDIVIADAKTTAMEVKNEADKTESLLKNMLQSEREVAAKNLHDAFEEVRIILAI